MKMEPRPTTFQPSSPLTNGRVAGQHRLKSETRGVQSNGAGHTFRLLPKPVSVKSGHFVAHLCPVALGSFIFMLRAHAIARRY
jgi:hypothetical protein